jgi:hypothetical protein
MWIRNPDFQLRKGGWCGRLCKIFSVLICAAIRHFEAETRIASHGFRVIQKF